MQWYDLGSLQPLPLGSSDSPASASWVSASWVAEITGACHHAWLISVFSGEKGFLHAGQVGLKLLTSGDLPTLVFQSAGITDMSHHTSLFFYIVNLVLF